MSDEGISELLGYAILAGTVITAVICIASGAAGIVSSSVQGIGLSEAGLAVGSVAAMAADVAHANNTYDAVSQLQVPPGYELLALDADDDMARLAVISGGAELFSARVGSIRLQSPFRSVSFEGGAVFSNDSGFAEVVRRPSVYTLGREEGAALYLCLIGISTDSCVFAGGSPVVVRQRSAGQKTIAISVPPSAPLTVLVWSRDPDGWSVALQAEGFAVERSGRAVSATIGGVTDVCVDSATVQVEIE